MLSYWEKSSLLNTDISIVGGGIVGLSVAASVKERWPEREVTVLERSLLPYGASTRNAGFACFGSLTEILSDIENMGSDAAIALIRDRWRGLKVTRNRLGDDAIGFQSHGGFELIEAERSSALDALDDINHLVQDFLPNYIRRRKDFESLGLNQSKGASLVEMNQEGQLDTGLLMRSLEQYCIERGVRIRTGANVLNIDSADGNHELQIEDPHRGRIVLKSNHAIICTNAFAGLDVDPGRGQVFITKPIKGLKFKGSLHIDEGYFYLRNVGDRILFGGGRNLDFETENTTRFGINEEIQMQLKEKMKQLILDVDSAEIEMKWSGIMAFGQSKTPIVSFDEHGRLLAIKMSGMGIALAGHIGERVVELLAGK